MTEASLKGLTWATWAAGVSSALLLAAIGCIKPGAGEDERGRLRSGLSPASRSDGAQHAFGAQGAGEQRGHATEVNLSSAPH